MIKSLINKQLSRFGFTLYRNEIIDKSEDSLTEHPLLLLSGSAPNLRYLLKVPVGRIRAWGGRRICRYLHPFMDVIHDYCNHGVENYSGSALERFAIEYSPRTAAESLGLPSELAPGFASLPPQMAIFPWEVEDCRENQRRYLETLKRELSPYTKEGVQRLALDGSARGQAEMNRVIGIYNSIAERGFTTAIPKFHPLIGQVLIGDKQEWVVLIRQGEHRVAALAASGRTEIPVILRYADIVRNAECEFWPQVKNRRVTCDGAADIFCRIVSGEINAPLINAAGWFF